MHDRARGKYMRRVVVCAPCRSQEGTSNAGGKISVRRWGGQKEKQTGVMDEGVYVLAVGGICPGRTSPMLEGRKRASQFDVWMLNVPSLSRRCVFMSCMTIDPKSAKSICAMLEDITWYLPAEGKVQANSSRSSQVQCLSYWSFGMLEDC
uniref:Uncharacterized protein n=2 Tax=Trieres chinensis TaxID=1514140 RepID=A0A7S1ZCU9_TRICV|mmetsp:Transcript_22798/g.46275  ORF Transcript_22798/g.46275 Transcript_22798/m.46275 type:complete len:150 (+) Transcript_22798:167-616(+)